MSDEPRRKRSLDLHIKCGCGGVFSLELCPSEWQYFSDLVALGRAWVATHSNCKKAPPEPETKP